VRENQLAAAEYLLDHGADPIGPALNDSLLDISRDRGYPEMEAMLVAKIELARISAVYVRHAVTVAVA
jgi:hypothetical protein